MPAPAEPAPGEGAAGVDLRPPRRVHVVGVGGAGMSGIATVLAAMGHRVTGSDLKASPVTERLGALGIEVMIGHRAAQVEGAEIVTYSPAVREDNPELRRAAELGAAVHARWEILSAVAQSRRSIAVAGTHGKTTTSSMLALILVESGLRPSFLIGADISDLGTNAVWDDGEWLILEADESFGSFRALRPEIGVVTNVEPDHLDHYESFEHLQEAFDQFLSGAGGPRVVCADDPVAFELGRANDARSVGTNSEADVVMEDIELSRSAVAFGLREGSSSLGRLTVPVPGKHNARNAAVAAVTALEAGARFEEITTALARFAGVPRRFEFRGESRGVTFVDDYAHLPSEVAATLEAARAGGWARLVVVFQPHRYSRTAALAPSFAHAFDQADALVVTDVYAAGEAPVPGVSGNLVAEAVRAAGTGPPVTYAPGRDELRQVVAGMLRRGDLCCTLGAGDLTTLADELIARTSW